MREIGVVQSVNKNEVFVRLKRRSACLGCGVCHTDSSGDMVIRIISPDDVKAGDKVTVEIGSASLFKAISLVYVLPTVFFVIGILAGLRIAPLLGLSRHKEILSAILGIILLCASMFLARGYGIRRKEAYQAKIIGII